MLVSDIARTFDVLGWFSPAVIKVTILLQRLREEEINWDNPAPSSIPDAWHKWKSKLPCILSKAIPRCYHLKDVQIISKRLHRFSNASEVTYAAVDYLRMVRKCPYHFGNLQDESQPN